MADRRNTPRLRYRPSERARSTVNGTTARGHLRHGFHVGAQLRAQLFEDIYAGRPAVDPGQGHGDQGRRTPVHHVHRPAMGHRPTAGPSGGYEILRLQMS